MSLHIENNSLFSIALIQILSMQDKDWDDDLLLYSMENIFGEIPHELQKHIDYHSYGNELEMDDRYLFTTSGVFRYQ